MHAAYLIAILAGLLSGAAVLTAQGGGAGSAIVVGLLGALPLFVVGLRWTWAAALLAAAAGALLVHMMGGSGGIGYALYFGAPAVFLTFIANVHASVTEGDGTERVQWASPGLIVMAAALLAGGLTAYVATSPAYDAQVAALRTEMTKYLEANAPFGSDKPLPPDQIALFVDAIAGVMPAMMGAVSMLVWLANLWLAGRVVHHSGNLARPWPDLTLMRFPAGSPLFLAAATFAATTLSGVAGTAASGVSGALFLAYTLLGLAIVHYLTRGKSWRPLALGVVYAALVAVNIYMALPLIMLALIDTVFSLRRPQAGDST
jgi:hypothetical protein